MKTVASAIALACAVSVVMPLAARRSPVAQGDPKPRRVVVTESDYATTIRVNKGDLIEVRLLAGVPSYWARPEPNPLLRSVDRLPTSESTAGIPVQMSTDGLSTGINLFEVVGERDDPFTLKVMYCNFRSADDVRAKREPKDRTDVAFWTRQRIARKEITRQKFRRGLSASDLKEGMVLKECMVLKEGMVFEVRLQTTDDTQPASKQARTAK